jgi:hypothetical protein
VWAGICFAVVSRPDVDDVTSADAIVVLGAPDSASLAEVERLTAEGVSDSVVIFTPYGEPDMCSEQPADLDVSCLVPVPPTTRGEARAIGTLAEVRGWTSIAVVTWTEHISRSRMLVERCYDHELAMVAYDDPAAFPRVLERWIYESGAFVKVGLMRDC